MQSPPVTPTSGVGAPGALPPAGFRFDPRPGTSGDHSERVLERFGPGRPCPPPPPGKVPAPHLSHPGDQAVAGWGWGRESMAWGGQGGRRSPAPSSPSRGRVFRGTLISAAQGVQGGARVTAPPPPSGQSLPFPAPVLLGPRPLPTPCPVLSRAWEPLSDRQEQGPALARTQCVNAGWALGAAVAATSQRVDACRQPSSAGPKEGLVGPCPRSPCPPYGSSCLCSWLWD